MPAPALVTAAKVAATNPRVRRGIGGLIGVLILTPIIVLFMAVAFFAQADCNAGGADDFAGQFDGPGSLGGVMGTGVTRSELRAARSQPQGGTSIVPHEYTSTAYAPAAGGINCDVGNQCGSTASGIRVNAGRRKAYLVASNPAMNKYGALVYAWPNPYGWKGPFVVADTGGNFNGSDGQYRVDFYIWGDANESRSNAWGRRGTRLSTRPIVSGGPTTDVDTTIGQLTGDDEGDVASGEQCAGGGETPPDGTTGYQGVLQWADWLDKQQYPYCYGGGHVTPAVPTHGQYCWNRAGTAKISTGKGYDCSSSTSFILQHAGYRLETMATPGFATWGNRGPGQRVTIYNKPYGADAHVFLKIGNRFFSTSVTNPAHGPGWVPASVRSTAGFTMSHPEGL